MKGIPIYTSDATRVAGVVKDRRFVTTRRASIHQLPLSRWRINGQPSEHERRAEAQAAKSAQLELFAEVLP